MNFKAFFYDGLLLNNDHLLKYLFVEGFTSFAEIAFLLAILKLIVNWHSWSFYHIIDYVRHAFHF